MSRRRRELERDDVDDIESDGLDSPSVLAEDADQELLDFVDKVRRIRLDPRHLAWWAAHLRGQGVDLLW